MPLIGGAEPEHVGMRAFDGNRQRPLSAVDCPGVPCHGEADRRIAQRLGRIVEADDRRFAWLAGDGVDCGTVVEGFSVLLDDFWCFLGDAIRERIGEENDSLDIEGTNEDRIRAFRAMIDAAMAAEKARGA